MDVKQFGPWAAVLDSTGSPVVVTQRERCRSFWPDWEPQSCDANVSACIGDHTEPALQSDSNRLAVAQLIAAAPELLEALTLAIQSMQDSGYPNTHVAVLAARQAIRKAKGEL